MNLGGTLKQLRLERDMTLSQLAKEVGSHVGNLSRIERGTAKPSLDLLYRIAAALDYHLADIFSLGDEQHFIDSRQATLNMTFLGLPEEDQHLLLEFARLLKARATRQQPLPGPQGEPPLGKPGKAPVLET
ncbi:helix-turn-helix transcriptional regulator [Billgrantia pellis]|uniref:Helix-turn-helix transcriptional regulator n=1 Tax=Billgrantia pellis TaxID=2606936 RepID=A0A7V7G224_9GAMM|nr:helix-turn-helix transcriptional regulator [Halomonas pellis]KAA0014125.1 helix-turn-helix transcriptional regulator [Halomonas pellis]